MMETPCREYMGSRDKDGYGQIHKSSRVHRYVWTLMYGPIPDGMQVLHHCDNPPCFRLDHLFLGTPKDNALDRDKKKRGKDSRKTHCSKGHLFNYTDHTGRRVCTTCIIERRHRRELLEGLV